MEEIKNVEMTEEEADQVAGGGAVRPPSDAEARHRLKETPIF